MVGTGEVLPDTTKLSVTQRWSTSSGWPMEKISKSKLGVKENDGDSVKRKLDYLQQLPLPKLADGGCQAVHRDVTLSRRGKRVRIAGVHEVRVICVHDALTSFGICITKNMKSCFAFVTLKL